MEGLKQGGGGDGTNDQQGIQKVPLGLAAEYDARAIEDAGMPGMRHESKHQPPATASERGRCRRAGWAALMTNIEVLPGSFSCALSTYRDGRPCGRLQEHGQGLNCPKTQLANNKLLCPNREAVSVLWEILVWKG